MVSRLAPRTEKTQGTRLHAYVSDGFPESSPERPQVFSASSDVCRFFSSLYGVLGLLGPGRVTAMAATVAAVAAPTMMTTAVLWLLSQGAPASQEH
jgi:hypothetical protein